MCTYHSRQSYSIDLLYGHCLRCSDASCQTGLNNLVLMSISTDTTMPARRRHLHNLGAATTPAGTPTTLAGTPTTLATRPGCDADKTPFPLCALIGCGGAETFSSWEKSVPDRLLPRSNIPSPARGFPLPASIFPREFACGPASVNEPFELLPTGRLRGRKQTEQTFQIHLRRYAAARIAISNIDRSTVLYTAQ